MSPSDGIEATMPAHWYVNWACDMFVPRGYWNLVSFADFVSRGLENGLRSIAIDVSGVFWRENLRDYVLLANCWVLNGVEEVVLYDPRGDELWKGSEYLDKFRRRHKDGPRVLTFEPLETPGDDLLHVQKLLNRCWDKCEGVVKDEDVDEEVRARSYLDDFTGTTKGPLLRPEVKLMKLVTTKPRFSTKKLSSGAGVLD